MRGVECLRGGAKGWVWLLLLAASQAAYVDESSKTSDLPMVQLTPAAIQHDPTKPYSRTQDTSGQLNLRSILIGRERRVALINDTFVEIGDTIGTSTIIAINADSVVLLDSGRTQTLYLFTNDIRK